MPFQGPESYGRSAVTAFKHRYGGLVPRYRPLSGHMPPPYFARREVHLPGSRQLLPGHIDASPRNRLGDHRLETHRPEERNRLGERRLSAPDSLGDRQYLGPTELVVCGKSLT